MAASIRAAQAGAAPTVSPSTGNKPTGFIGTKLQSNSALNSALPAINNVTATPNLRRLVSKKVCAAPGIWPSISRTPSA